MTRREDEEKLRRKAQAILMMRRRDRNVQRGGVSGTGGYGPYVSAYVSRLDALGYTKPSTATLTAMDAFFTSISSVVTKIDLLRIMALNNASLQDAATINLINPSLYSLVPTASPNYSTLGFAGNGSTSYMANSFIPSVNGVNFTLNSASRFFYIETAPTLGTLLDGNLTIAISQCTASLSTQQRINSSNNLNSSSSFMSTGFKAINRSSSTDVQIYDGGVKADRTQTSTSLPTEDQLLGRRTSSFSNARFGLYGLGGSLTESEYNIIASAYATFRTSIGL